MAAFSAWRGGFGGRCGWWRAANGVVGLMGNVGQPAGSLDKKDFGVFVTPRTTAMRASGTMRNQSSRCTPLAITARSRAAARCSACLRDPALASISANPSIETA